MKNALTFVLLVAGCALFAGEALDIKGDFKSEKDGIPVGWIQNKGKWAEPFGEVKVVDEADGQKAVEIKSTKKATHLYSSKFFPAAAGDKIEVSLKYKGEGKGAAGIYMYNAQKRWVTNEYKGFKAEAEWKEAKFVLTVKDKGDKKSENIRVVIYAGQNSSILFKDIKAQKL